MFTLEQIKTAHSRMKDGSGFPNYICELKELGVRSYTSFVADGHTEYRGAEDSRPTILVSPPLYDTKAIHLEVAASPFADRLRLHQQGGTTYFQFCEDCAKTGVERWVVDAEALTCTYFSVAGTVVVVEAIPAGHSQ